MSPPRLKKANQAAVIAAPIAIPASTPFHISPTAPPVLRARDVARDATAPPTTPAGTLIGSEEKKPTKGLLALNGSQLALYTWLQAD